MRLLGWTAAHLPERDGAALMNGRSLAGLSPRQACNLAFGDQPGVTAATVATLLAGHENPEDRDTFTEDLMFDGNPEADAMAAVREMQRVQQAQEEAAGGG